VKQKDLGDPKVDGSNPSPAKPFSFFSKKERKAFTEKKENQAIFVAYQPLDDL